MIFLNWILLCLRTLVAAVFIAYALGKLRNPSAFAAIIRSHHLIPDTLSSISSWILIVLEGMLGMLFLFNIFPLAVGIVIGSLLMLFSGILLRSRLILRLNVEDCGCSGTRSRKTTLEKALFRNAVLICAVATIVATISTSKAAVPSQAILIEFAIFVCTLVGVICTHAQLLISTRRTVRIEAIRNRRERFSVSAVNSSRRSFIKWGVQFGVATILGVGFLWDKASNVLAASPNSVSEPCPHDEACDCGPGGKGPWSGSTGCSETFTCDGHEGQYVPLMEVCVVWCCGSNYECDVYEYQVGTVYCGPGC